MTTNDNPEGKCDCPYCVGPFTADAIAAESNRLWEAAMLTLINRVITRSGIAVGSPVLTHALLLAAALNNVTWKRAADTPHTPVFQAIPKIPREEFLRLCDLSYDRMMVVADAAAVRAREAAEAILRDSYPLGHA